MKLVVLGIAALMTLSAPAVAQDQPYNVQHFYFDENGQYVGRFVIYCNGEELLEGRITDRVQSHYGSCNAP